MKVKKNGCKADDRQMGMVGWKVDACLARVGWSEARTPTYWETGLRWGSFVTPTYDWKAE